jgi:D-arabinose 1-dehydrogenase-like Zn-dependent alcohol dehydrogenase
MGLMRAAEVREPGGKFELVERPIPDPPEGSVRVRVEACGICHSDALVVEGNWPNLDYPRIPGHEVAGVIDALGPKVEGWNEGDRVGIGWHGSHCGHCDSCRRGDFFACRNGVAVTGASYDGGYADYMIAPSKALARIPEGLSPIEAGPLMCAGLTTFNALRHCGARPGDRVAILGIGGLGHLGVQYANKMGFETIAIARGTEKAGYAMSLGAHHYIDSRAENPSQALSDLGGAHAIIATVTDGPAMGATVGGLAPHGKLMILGAGGPFEVDPVTLLMGKRSVMGWYSGTSIDSQDTLAFSDLQGVRSSNEVYPLLRVQEAYDRMMSGEARFRVVLATGL